jgi:hypothetical protein
LKVGPGRRITGAMIDKDQKNAILAAEREFERRENLSRALAESGVTLIGKITSAPPAQSATPLAAETGSPRPAQTETPGPTS